MLASAGQQNGIIATEICFHARSQQPKLKDYNDQDNSQDPMHNGDPVFASGTRFLHPSASTPAA
jgi:hypothetical protein